MSTHYLPLHTLRLACRSWGLPHLAALSRPTPADHGTLIYL